MNEAQQDPEFWGRLVESAVGASLANGIKGKGIELCYWASRNKEVDFILRRAKDVTVIEVKSGRKKTSLPGVEAFSREFRVKRKLLVGSQGIRLKEFLLTPPEQWID